MGHCTQVVAAESAKQSNSPHRQFRSQLCMFVSIDVPLSESYLTHYFM